MRERLDSVHLHVGLPVLHAAHYDSESLTDIAVAEEAAILEELGLDVYASGSQGSAVLEPDDVVPDSISSG